MTAATSKENGY